VGRLAVIVAVAACFFAAGADARLDAPAGGGALRIDSQPDFDYVDPALSSFSHSQQLHVATCARLVRYPDKAPPEGSTLVPDAAVSLPTISPNGRKYTFTIRDGFRFSPPSNEPVDARTFKLTFERLLNPRMQSPGSSYFTDIVGATDYYQGRASEIRGIDAKGMTLKFTLTGRHGDFLARLALTYACAVPTDAPIDPAGSMLPSAGPYYLVSWNRGQTALAVRNPNYDGERASNFDALVWQIGVTCANQILRVEADQTDYATCVPSTERSRLRETYGPGRPLPQQYFAEPAPVFWYIVLNTERAAFAKKKLRQAVAYALSRIELTARFGFDGGRATDQILPSGITGYRDDDVFPLAGDLEKAKELAAEAGVDPDHPLDVVMYTFNTSVGIAVADYVRTALQPLGIIVSIQVFDRFEQHTRIARRGEPFDVSIEGWGADYNDPFNFLDVLLNGDRIRDDNNTNVSYFDDPGFNARLDAAARLPVPARYPAYADLDRDLSAAAPIVPFINTNFFGFFTARIGCQEFTPLHGVALNALCLR
jgi:peptide/nickel transport system substrate-binding protein